MIESTVLGGQAGTSRRIENYLGFPAGISGSELTSRAIAQARKFGARTATPYRARALEPGDERHLVKLDDGNEIAARAVLLATGAEYRRLPVADLDRYEGISVFYAAGPPEAQLCGAQRVGVIGGGNSAAQAAVWLARGGALVTLLHRRADLRETMSHYLIDELERYGVAVRDRSEVARPARRGGRLEAVTLTDGTELALSFLFLFLGATPCTEPVLSAEENVLLPLSIAGREVDREWFDRLVDTVGIRDRLSHRPAELSGGQQQRVAVARALISRPAVVFADRALRQPRLEILRRRARPAAPGGGRLRPDGGDGHPRRARGVVR